MLAVLALLSLGLQAGPGGGEPGGSQHLPRLDLHGRLFLDLPGLDGEQGRPRSLRLQARLHLDEHASARVQLEHGRGELEVFEASFTYRDEEWGEARLGHHRPPAGSEARTSLSVLPSPERSAPVRALLPSRATGLSYGTRTAEGWSLGAFGGARRALDPIGSQRLVVGRRDWELEETTATSRSHLGLWAMHWNGGADGLRLDARPWGGSRARTVDSGDLVGARAVGAGLEWCHVRPDWVLQNETIVQRIEGPATEDAGSPWGSTVTLVLPRGGLQRSWSATRQALHHPDHVVPHRSHEWVLRASWLDLEPVGGSRQTELAVGVNLYVSRRSRWMFHLQRTAIERAADLDVLLLRIQAGF